MKEIQNCIFACRTNNLIFKYIQVLDFKIVENEWSILVKMIDDLWRITDAYISFNTFIDAIQSGDLDFAEENEKAKILLMKIEL